MVSGVKEQLLENGGWNMRSNTEAKSKERSAKFSSLEAEPDMQNDDAKGYGGMQSGGRQDEWLLKYDVNEKGVGRILLPPSLSILLQSDRVSITPSGGGLFIRSV
jgi:hypothetical protein